MKKRFLPCRLAAFVVALALMAMPLCASAAVPLTIETQFTYGVSNPAWLKDLTVKENMLDINSLAKNLKLEALPDYPYSMTPDTFKEEVEYFIELYSLDEGSRRAAYVYVLNHMGSFSAAASSDVSDEQIKVYLENKGIIYPVDGLENTENLIFARALYSVMSVDALGVKVPAGTTLEGALVLYLSKIFGDDMASLLMFNSGLSLESLEDYVTVVCKVALNVNGYTVSPSTPKEEVYRLMAIQTIREVGISVDENNVSFEELKLKYLAATLGLQYDISVDPLQLQSELAASNAHFYILRLLGQSRGLAVRQNQKYSDAFMLVAENSDIFALETGEFYADIYNYKVQLEYLRDKIWVSPTALSVANQDGQSVTVTVNGKNINSGTFCEVELNKSIEMQAISIGVTYIDAEQTATKVYTLKVYQGLVEAPASENVTVPGNSLIGIIANNTFTRFSTALGESMNSLPPRISGIMSLLMPTIGGEQTSQDNTTGGLISSAGDFLSALIFKAQNSSTGNVVGVGSDTINPPVTNPSLPGYISPQNGGSFGSSATTQGININNAGAPPTGYSYLVNDSGYIIGISPDYMIKDQDQGGSPQAYNPPAAPIGTADSGVTWEMAKGVLPYIALPVSLALVTLAFVFIFKKKST